jgi:hypothetical protein
MMPHRERSASATLILGNTELVEVQCTDEGLLGEGLSGQYPSGPLRSFVSLWRTEQDTLLDLSQTGYSIHSTCPYSL